MKISQNTTFVDLKCNILPLWIWNWKHTYLSFVSTLPLCFFSHHNCGLFPQRASRWELQSESLQCIDLNFMIQMYGSHYCYHCWCCNCHCYCHLPFSSLLLSLSLFLWLLLSLSMLSLSYWLFKEWLSPLFNFEVELLQALFVAALLPSWSASLQRPELHLAVRFLTTDFVTLDFLAYCLYWDQKAPCC